MFGKTLTDVQQFQRDKTIAATSPLYSRSVNRPSGFRFESSADPTALGPMNNALYSLSYGQLLV